MSFPCHFCVPIFSEMCLITYNVLLLNFLTVYYYNTFYLFWLLIFNKIPILHIVINRLLPPYDRKGRVTPVTGISPTTTIRLSIVWNDNPKVIPKARYLPNESSHFIAILNPDIMIIRNKVVTNNTIIKPNSSLIIEKIKSVCCSGN